MDRPGPKPQARHARSLVKAISWRVIGTLDTFLWAILITHEPFHAGAIASLETLTKIALYYLHERVWSWLPMDHRSRTRALVKAFTWRLTGSLDTFLLSILITGNAKYAVSIATGEAVTKIVLYYVHERVWNRIEWGRKAEADAAAAAALAAARAG